VTESDLGAKVRPKPERRDTLAAVVEVRAPYRWERGPAWISYLYLVFRQLLAFGDLLGKDGRPSSTKLAAASIVIATLLRPALFTAADVWALMLGVATLFGWRGFQLFLEFKKDKAKLGDLNGGV